MRHFSRSRISTLFLALITSFSPYWTAQAHTSQNASETPNPQGQTKLQFSSGALLRAELDKTLDVKKLKVGDPVAAKLTDDLKWNQQILAPKGSRIMGHVTQATQHNGSTASVLGLSFEKLVLKDGSEVALKSVIQAIGFPDAATQADDPVAGGTPSGRGPVPGQIAQPGGTLGQPAGYEGGRIPDSRSNNPTGLKLSPNARGVVGLPGASLSVGSAGDSLITSEKHNVKIESGAQVILRTQ